MNMKLITSLMMLILPIWTAAQDKAVSPQTKPSPDQPKKPPRPAPPKTDEESMMPSLSRSPTGYIDDAAVGTELRVRFDAGFGMTTPDRAEFFYAKCGCFRYAGLDPGAAGPGPGIVTNLRFQELHINYEHRFFRQFSLFVDAPFRSIQPTQVVGASMITAKTGPSDLQYGFKLAPIAGPAGYLTFQLRAYQPTGNSSLGLGTNHYSIEPAVLFTRKVAPRMAMSGQFSLWHPIGGATATPLAPAQQFSSNVLEYGLGGSYQFHAGENVRVGPVLEFVGWNVRQGYVTEPTGPAPGSGVNIVNAKLGARVVVGGHNSLYFGFGRQLSHVGWYRDFLRLEYAHAF
jgi:hypothetical protein